MSVQFNTNALALNRKLCDEIYEKLFYDMSCKYSYLKQYTNRKELVNEKFALFGVSINMNGFYERKQILKPSKDILKDRKIIIFTENKFEEIEKCIQDMGLNCVNYKLLMK